MRDKDRYFTTYSKPYHRIPMTRFERIGRRAVTVFLDALFFLVLFGLVTGDEFSEMWEDHAQWYLRNKRTASGESRDVKYGSFMGEAGSIGRGRGLP
ncbi:MAG TPA: hypothetical protein P5520_02795 [Desulfomonilia bacterium]|nr:hypothetical protein [Desulfomonilia bacterium]